MKISLLQQNEIDKHLAEAKIALDLNKINDAQCSYKKAIDIYNTRTSFSKQELQKLSIIYGNYLELGLHKNSENRCKISDYEKNIELKKDSSETTKEVARAYLLLGERLQLDEDNINQAIEKFNIAEAEIYKDNNYDLDLKKLLVRIYENLILCYDHQENHDARRDTSLKFLDIIKPVHKNQNKLANHYFKLGKEFAQIERYTDSLICYEKAKNISLNSANNAAQLCELYFAMSESYFLKDQLSDALEVMQECREKLGDTKEIIFAIYSLHIASKDIEQINHYQKLYDNCDKVDSFSSSLDLAEYIFIRPKTLGKRVREQDSSSSSNNITTDESSKSERKKIERTEEEDKSSNYFL